MGKIFRNEKMITPTQVTEDNKSLAGLISGDATEITIPYGVTEIAGYAFAYKGLLEKINIPDTVVTIGISPDSAGGLLTTGYVFGYCTSLKEIKFPNTITSGSASDMFRYCTNLENVYNFPKFGNISDACFYNCEKLKTFEIPDNCEIIMSRAFENCKMLKLTNLHNVKNFEYACFSNCKNLTNLKFDAAGHIEFGNNVFMGCDNLNHLIFPNVNDIPTIQTTTFPKAQQILVEVPVSLLDEWKSATNWSAYQNMTFKAYPYTIPDTTYTFVTDGGTPVEPITTNQGLQIAPVTTSLDSTKDFLGWYLDSTFTQRVSFPYNNFEGGAITMYAKYGNETGESKDKAIIISNANLNNTLFSTVITNDNVYSGTTQNNWKSAWYKFTPEETRNYWLTDNNTDLYIVILNEDGSVYAEYDYEGEPHQLEAGKTYYYAISIWNGALGEIMFKLNKSS